MQNKSVFMMAALFVFSALMCAANAHAFGIGPYVEFASGSGSFNEDGGQLYMTGDDGDIDVGVAGFGVVMDTNLSRNRVFNYRLSLGYNTLDYPDEIDGWRVSLDNTFGFGIVKTDRFRLWIGPQLHLSYGKMEIPLYENGYSYYYYDYDNYFGDYYDELTDDVDVVGYGLGLVTGANINLPRVGSFCAELGVRYQGNATDTYEEERYVSDYYYYNGNYYSSGYNEEYTVDYSYDETVVFFKLSFMFGK